MKSKTAPSLQVIFSLDKKYHNRRLVISENIARFEKAAIFILKVEPSKATPNIKVGGQIGVCSLL